VSKTENLKYTLLLFFCTAVLFSCNPTRQLIDGQYLLERNRIQIEDAEIKRDELNTYVRQRPNRKILGFYRFHLNVYQFANRGRETRIRSWMKNTIGEPPVLYDPVLTQSTLRQFELYMHSKGYFNADIDHEITFRRKRAFVTYEIKGNKPYMVNRIDYRIQDQFVGSFILKDTVNSVLEAGQRYDANEMQNERDRIERSLRNQGFFNFSREFILFRVDSNLNQNKVNIELLVNNPVRPLPGIRDSVIELRHRRYLVDKVYILPEFSPLQADLPRNDTTIFVRQRGDDTTDQDYFFLHNGPLRIKPRVIANHIMVRPGEYFRINDVEQTYSFLSGMRNFRFINLQFSEINNPVFINPSDTLGFLQTQVQLNRTPSNAFTIEAEGLNSAGNLGVAGNLLYQNRNIFRGAEILNLRFKGALEVTGESRAEEVIQRLPFNTLEMGVEAGIDFPVLLLPFPIERLSRNARPKSYIVTGINYRQRPDYTRYVLNLNYGFEWNETPQKRHFINPLELSSIRVFNDSILRANIPESNPLLLSRFKDHLIHGIKYTYVYNTQQLGRTGNFLYLRTNFESAGNLLNIGAETLGLNRNENGSYTIFNIPFAQYLKGDADFRYYRVFDVRRSLVFRLMGGLGVPYGNVDVLPFIKSYYGGGANGIRAWKIYSLGPGGYPGTEEIRFDRYGDIKLEANVEYRFGIYRFWHGAFFIDTGNVWFLRENKQFPGGEFRFSRLADDIAIGGGLGIRMDFDFFVLRIDAGVPFKDPSRASKEQWISGWPAFNQFNFNLGIGYPF
jgi:hypothetical protein